MKSGWKTTEFWLALVVTVGGSLATYYSEAEWAKVVGIVAAALASAGYGLSRASVKKAEAENL